MLTTGSGFETHAVVDKAESAAQTVSGVKRFEKRWNWTIMTGSMEAINVAGVGGHIDGMTVNPVRAASIPAGKAMIEYPLQFRGLATLVYERQQRR
ncbi:MAG: hypothetical protein KJP16_09175 [Gammaproteobacteria bacterium]|nr:hypothetical protein [Gammaproteobacteria bacterium]NNL50975.1 hypothetical protein [Woeseiaceae bacterium]